MGNCQASEAAVVVIQHPGGKVERLYWPTSAADVMKSNPGHYVALVTLTVSETKQGGGAGGHVKFTRLRLLKTKDVLLLGRVYRLITSQEATQAIMQRKHEKLRKNQAESRRGQQREEEHGKPEQRTEEQQEDSENKPQVAREDTDRQKSSTQAAAAAAAAARGRHWRPSLKSISEAAS